MIISVRLDDDDLMQLEKIKIYMDKRWSEIFIDDPTTNSQAIRACIRYAYQKLIEEET